MSYVVKVSPTKIQLIEISLFVNDKLFYRASASSVSVTENYVVFHNIACPIPRYIGDETLYLERKHTRKKYPLPRYQKFDKNGIKQKSRSQV
jgi:hypothetical protein